MPDIPNIDWNDNGIELITLTETEDQKLKKIVAFFEILEADNVGEGIITLLYNNGYKKIEDILMMNNSDLECIDGIGKRKASIIIDSIKKSTTDVDLSKLMHATSIFKGLGSKKLKLVEHFKSKPTIEDILSIEGFAEISANAFIDGFDEFYEFCEKLPNLTFKKEVEKSSNILIGKSFCFTGVRLPEIEKVIIDNGGKISSGVSKSLTYLVCKDINSGSSKLTKATSLGVVLLDIEKLEELLRGI
jgi:NAD-dependent DNA ligase